MSRRKDEQIITGINAVEWCFKKRPNAIRRAFFTMQQTKKFGSLMSFCAKQRLPYRVVESEELSRIASTSHHEGACVVTDPLESLSLRAWLEELPSASAVCAVATIGVSNPHNLGALMRSAAHFGLSGVLSEESALFTSGAVSRTAQGGAEFVPVVQADLFRHKALLAARDFAVITTSSHQGESLFDAAIPGRCIFVVGAEGEGLTGRDLHQGDMVVRIPGSGLMESLNVSVASGLLFAEWFRRHGTSIARDPKAEVNEIKPDRAEEVLPRKRARKVYEIKSFTRKKPT